MDTILRFGDGGAAGRKFNFEPESQISLSDNFKDMVTATSRMPGISGGFNAYRGAALPGAIGTISYTFWMHFDADDPEETMRRRDALAGITNWGVQRLYKQSMSGEIRWCWAVVNNAPINFNVNEVPHRRQRITITFHVPEPFWYRYPFEALHIDSGWTLDSGRTLGGWTNSQYVLEGPQVVDVVIGGTVDTAPLIRVEASGRAPAFLGDPGLVIGQPGFVLGGVSSGSVDGLHLQRVDLDTLSITHDLLWDGLVTDKDRLVIDCVRLRVVHEDTQVGNVSGWPETQHSRAGLFTLSPGVNRIRIDGDFTGSVLLVIEYLERYR